jgi:hypothetical protein
MADQENREPGTCKGCGAQVVWVKMPSGKRMPLDAKAQQMIQVSNDGQRGRVLTVHTSHFATCPKARGFRRRASSPCSACGEPQFATPSGLSCPNGHGGAPPKEDV